MGFLYDESDGDSSSQNHTNVFRTEPGGEFSVLYSRSNPPCDSGTHRVNMAEGGPSGDSQIPHRPPQGTDTGDGRGSSGEPPIPLIPPPPSVPRVERNVSGNSIDGQDKSQDSNGVGDGFSFEIPDISEDVLKGIEEKLAELEDIPDICDNIPIECFCEETKHQLCYVLDHEMQTFSDSGLTKDYMGMGEWIGLEQPFLKYLRKTMIMHKTIEVLAKWITLEGEPRPTIGNFKECMVNGIDRPDAVTQLAKHITKDAISWVRTGSEACTVPQPKVDKSWQLTRHDVVTGKKTFYTCCLVYADEDEGMTQIITKLYKSVSKEALFFLPQFDLKFGKYVFDTTAKVIQERCEGRVIFILSEYFFASEVCRFAVNFSRAIDASADAGNLIPFHLTNKYDHVPRVLKGIAGIRWFRKPARTMSWTMMTDTILGGRVEVEELENLKERMLTTIEKNPSEFLSDPPYDEDTPSPGPPISVHDPPLSEEMSAKFDPCQKIDQIESDLMNSVRETSSPKRLFKSIRKQVMGFFNNRIRSKRRTPDSDAIDLTVRNESERTPDPDSTFYDTSNIAHTAAVDKTEEGNQSGASHSLPHVNGLSEGSEENTQAKRDAKYPDSTPCRAKIGVNNNTEMSFESSADTSTSKSLDKEIAPEIPFDSYIEMSFGSSADMSCTSKSLESELDSDCTGAEASRESVYDTGEKRLNIESDNLRLDTTKENYNVAYSEDENESPLLVARRVSYHRSRSEPEEHEEPLI